MWTRGKSREQADAGHVLVASWISDSDPADPLCLEGSVIVNTGPPMVVELESSTSSEHAAEKIKSAKKKSRKSKEDPTGNAVEAETVVKKEKRKRKAAEAEQLEGEEDGVAEVKQDKTKKRKKHTDTRAEEDTTSGVVDEDTTKHKKKRKRRDPEDTSAGPSKTSELTNVQPSERKHKIPKPEKELKKKKKRKHSEHSFKDPSTDESLSEQASKGVWSPNTLTTINSTHYVPALSYAYTQADDLPNWKFNKARQNWLIRNILSEENVSTSQSISCLCRV